MGRCSPLLVQVTGSRLPQELHGLDSDTIPSHPLHWQDSALCSLKTTRCKTVLSRDAEAGRLAHLS